MCTNNTQSFIIKISATYCVLQSLVFILFIVAGVGQQDIKNYGPYELRWQIFEKCKGPKQRECGIFEIANVQNMSNVVFLLDFPTNCPATMGKIIVSTTSNNVTKKLWNYVLSNPCEHFVLGPILVDSFNLGQNCKINKGRYEIHLDFLANAKKFLGSRFFYGTYTFQIASYNKLKNFFCVKTIVDVNKSFKKL